MSVQKYIRTVTVYKDGKALKFSGSIVKDMTSLMPEMPNYIDLNALTYK